VVSGRPKSDQSGHIGWSVLKMVVALFQVADQPLEEKSAVDQPDLNNDALGKIGEHLDLVGVSRASRVSRQWCRAFQQPLKHYAADLKMRVEN
jgi:hypothetical protein